MALAVHWRNPAGTHKLAAGSRDWFSYQIVHRTGSKAHRQTMAALRAGRVRGRLSQLQGHEDVKRAGTERPSETRPKRDVPSGAKGKEVAGLWFQTNKPRILPERRPLHPLLTLNRQVLVIVSSERSVLQTGESRQHHIIEVNPDREEKQQVRFLQMHDRAGTLASRLKT
jgi:hypothetical protein